MRPRDASIQRVGCHLSRSTAAKLCNSQISTQPPISSDLGNRSLPFWVELHCGRPPKSVLTTEGPNFPPPTVLQENSVQEGSMRARSGKAKKKTETSQHQKHKKEAVLRWTQCNHKFCRSLNGIHFHQKRGLFSAPIFLFYPTHLCSAVLSRKLLKRSFREKR